MLAHVTSVNDFDYADQVELTQGDQVDVYFQLVDLTRAPSRLGYKPEGVRYMPASGATLQVRLDNIDDNVALTRAPVQAYPTLDPSIWRLSVLSTDTIRGTCALNLTLNESGKLTYGRREGAVKIARSGSM